jgi:hypothetical protein
VPTKPGWINGFMSKFVTATIILMYLVHGKICRFCEAKGRVWCKKKYKKLHCVKKNTFSDNASNTRRTNVENWFVLKNAWRLAMNELTSSENTKKGVVRKLKKKTKTEHKTNLVVH